MSDGCKKEYFLDRENPVLSMEATTEGRLLGVDEPVSSM